MFTDEFNKRDIENMSRIAEVNEGFITMMINNFRFQQGLHGYFRQKFKKGEELPTNQNELYEMMDQDSPEFREKNRDQMLKEVKQRLNYSEEHMRRNEQHNFHRRIKKNKKTYLY